MAAGVARGLQNRSGARTCLGWVRFPHVPATAVLLSVFALLGPSKLAGQDETTADADLERQAQAVNDSTPPITPFGALVRSMVIPGWGQSAVGRPTRGAIYFAGASASMYMVFKSHGKLSAAQRAEPPNDDLIDSRKRQRENWLVMYGFIAFVSALDAWVSTQFWDFEPELTVPDEGEIALGIRLTLPNSFR